MESARHQLSRIDELSAHPQATQLIEAVTGETDISSAGFPFISDHSFRILIGEVPHLFRRGQAVLAWTSTLEASLVENSEFPEADLESIRRATKVFRNVVFTAGVTAPPDLWVLRHVLSAHRELGVIDWLLSGRILDPVVYAREHGLDEHQLKTDLQLLHARGYLGAGDGDYRISPEPDIAAVVEGNLAIPVTFRRDMVPDLTDWLSTEGASEPELENWLGQIPEHLPTGSWVASQHEIELGYRLLPIVLGLRVLEITPELQRGTMLEEHVPNFAPEIGSLFETAGYAEGGEVTDLGARVFARGPGAFGIIGAYHTYLNRLPELLKSGAQGVWVRRGENVLASQDANRKTFTIANDRLDSFSKKTGFSYRVFIEHAVGRGEAIRQRFGRNRKDELLYFGADLEDAAIDRALKQQEQGVLPENLRFIRSADIGEPLKVIDYLAELGLADEPTVMMVGNGFHEIREQTNEKMVDVFRAYEQAHYLLIFTEESALHDEALIRTAWNTYHAGFRYVHEMSGQGLRPAVERERSGGRWSWRKCAERAGYHVLEEYIYRSRTIYPYRRPTHKNPSISVTYFCVPNVLANELGVG